MSIGHNILVELACLPGVTTDDGYKPRNDKAFFEPVVSAEGLHISAIISELNRFGVLVNKLNWRPVKGQLSYGKLLELARKVVKQITFLPERLAIIETDPKHQTVLVRSYPPRQNKNGIYFYEFELSAEEGITFCRYLWSSDTKETNLLPCYLREKLFIDLIDHIVEIFQ